MKNITIILFIITLAACGQDDSSDTSVGASSISTTAAADTSGGEAGGSTGSDSSPEHALCARTDECNVLMPGVSVQDCTDLETMCTDELISSAYQDWNAEVDDCLDLANCQNFMACASELSPCPPIMPDDECGPECDYCYIGTETENMCPDSYNGAMDGCDCGCQFVDLDCG